MCPLQSAYQIDAWILRELCTPVWKNRSYDMTAATVRIVVLLSLYFCKKMMVYNSKKSLL